MKKLFTIAAVMLLSFSWAGAQTGADYWKKSDVGRNQAFRNRTVPKAYETFSLDVKKFKSLLKAAPLRGRASKAAALIMSFPNAEGVMESYRIIEAPVLHPELSAKYPGIKSYAGQGVDDPSATIRFSLSNQKGLHAMVLSGRKGMSYIDPVNQENSKYVIYSRKSLDRVASGFECFTDHSSDVPSWKNQGSAPRSTDDSKLRKYRLALSCTAEYGNIFAGSGSDSQKKANILAQMNITMTRVNGVYERDLAVTLEIVPNNDEIIYFGSASSDPWDGEYNQKTQEVIDQKIGDANYDIGHNFNTTGGGNAGCIGCVCTSGSKGSGFTGRSDPTGDPFDIDYVAHEMGHQFGGYHTMNTCRRSGSGSTEVEPASGSSIMGYAGICSSNVQSNSDAYFAYVNIRDISANIQSGTSSSCAQIVNIANNAPTANAGSDYTIPKSTAFFLKGEGSDPDGDALTYTWEQNDPERAAGNGSPESTWTQGPLFRSKEGTASPIRYMPQLSDVIAGNLAPTWEVIPSVGRTMEFSLTVRDNKAGGGQTDDDLMTVTVDGNSGPFVVTSPNTSVTWQVGQSKTVTWDVANTNSSPVNCTNVNILLSLDGGNTYPVTLAENTPNDGSHAITVPNNASSTCRIKVQGANNIFYDISNADFSISGSVSCNATVPTGLSSSSVGSNSATLTWNAVPGADYEVRYKASNGSWTELTVSSNTASLTGLSKSTTYEAQVRSKCPDGTSSNYSSSINFTTQNGQTNYCDSKGNKITDEYISLVKLGSINNTSGENGGYGDFTSLSTRIQKGVQQTITIKPTWTGSTYNEGYAVWIDYNADGDFSDPGEQVFSKPASKEASVSGSFTVPSDATEGSTRMRVSMKYDGIPTSCENFSYGEVEDYTVVITNDNNPSCENVTLKLTFDKYPSEISWAIKDSSGKTVASGGPYGNSSDGDVVTEEKCLPAGCYDLVVSDSYGDGMCCKYGNGSYTLTNATGNVLASGGEFGDSETKNFCVGNANSARGNAAPQAKVQESRELLYPNPTQDKLNISINGEVKDVRIFSMDGIQHQSAQVSGNQVDVSRLKSGVYYINVQTKSGESYRAKFIKK